MDSSEAVQTKFKEVLTMRNKIFVTRADFTFDLQRFDDPPTINGLNYNSEGYYEISNEAELLAFANYARSNSTEGLTFRLTDDISLTKSGDSSNWEPSNLSGTLDGGIYDQNGNLIGNHTISNLPINDSSKSMAAFFNSISGTLKNVTLTNLFINGKNLSSTLACTNSGIIQNCAVQGNFIVAELLFAGIASYNNRGTLTGCFFDVNYNGNNFIASNTGSSYDNYSVSGSVDETRDKKVFRLDFPKGIVTTSNIFSYFGNSYATQNTQISFSISDDTDYEKITAVKFSGTALSADQNGFYSFTTDYEASTVSFEGYPKIEWLEFDAKGNFYKIQDADDLIALSNYVNGGHNCAGLTFKQSAAINMDGKTFEPIGNSDIWFAGTFDGGNFSISNLNIYNPDAVNQGLFGKTAKSAVISRINLLNAHITGGRYTGGIVGYNLGTVEDCYVDSDSNIHATKDCFYHGGITGLNDGSSAVVNNCLSSASVTFQDGLTNCKYFGSIVGFNSGSINNSFYYGSSPVGSVVSAYKITLPEHLNASNSVTFNGITYAGGEITLTPDVGYTFDGETTVTVNQNLTITGNVTVDTADHFARLDGNSYILINNADIPNYSDLIQVYVLNLPECVHAEGDILFSSNVTTYAAGDISLNPKIGYLVDDSNFNIFQDTDVEAHFDNKNHYVLADDTSTLANETNTADFPDLIQVLKVDGVNLAPADNIYSVGSDIYVKAGSTVSVYRKNFIINGDCDIAAYIDQYGVQQQKVGGFREK